MKVLVLWIVFLCGVNAWALPTGDVNGDGTVDVADLVRAKKMALRNQANILWRICG